MSRSRRTLLLGTVSVVSLMAAGYSFGAFDYFASTTKKGGVVSFDDARFNAQLFLKNELPLAEKAFGVKYSNQDFVRIYYRVWDSFKLALNESYAPKEEKTESIGKETPPLAVEERSRSMTTGSGARDDQFAPTKNR